MRMTLENRCSRSAVIRKMFIIAAMDGDGGGEWQWRGDVDDEVGAGRVRCGTGGVGQGWIWSASLGSTRGRGIRQHRRTLSYPQKRSPAGNRCMSKSVAKPR